MPPEKQRTALVPAWDRGGAAALEGTPLPAIFDTAHSKPALRERTTITAMRTTHQTLQRFIPVFALLLAIGGAIIACGSSSANAGSATTGGSSDSSASAKHFKVGDQIKVGDSWIVTVNSAKLHGPTDIDQPQSGNTYLVLDITFKNVSAKEQDLSSALQLSLKDSTGQTYDQTFVSFVTGSPDGKVAAGDLLRGQVVYEVSKAQKAFTLAFEADITSSGQSIWDINV